MSDLGDALLSLNDVASITRKSAAQVKAWTKYPYVGQILRSTRADGNIYVSRADLDVYLAHRDRIRRQGW